MKKFFKWVGIVIGAFIVIGVIAGIAGGKDTPTPQDTSKPAVQEQATTPTETPKKEEPAKVDKQAVYDAIKVGDALTGKGGDSYDSVIAKLGKPDTETESTSGDLKMVICGWFSLTDGSYTVTFMNGNVANKSITK